VCLLWLCGPCAAARGCMPVCPCAGSVVRVCAPRPGSFVHALNCVQCVHVCRMYIILHTYATQNDTHTHNKQQNITKSKTKCVNERRAYVYVMPYTGGLFLAEAAYLPLLLRWLLGARELRPRHIIPYT
jgi:hypothetical protein